MHFSHMNNGSGSKLTKIAIVTALHLAVGVALVKNMNHVNISKLIDEQIDVVFVPKKIVEPPPLPPEPPKQVQKTVTPPKPVIAPPPEVPIDPVPDQPTITAKFEANPVPADPGPSTPPEPAAKPAAQSSGGMRTAVLADAAGCAKPDYPARAARNNEMGTVSLALLVGADGRVADSRIQKSSGSRELDRAAISALSMCKFKPATNGGVPEQGWAQIAYVWTLES